MLAEVEGQLFGRVAGEVDELRPPGGVEQFEQRTDTEAVAIEAGMPKRLQAEDVPTPVESAMAVYRPALQTSESPVSD